MHTQSTAMTNPAHATLAHVFYLSVATLIAYLMLIAPAHAEAIGDAICTIVVWVLDGNLGRGLATLGVITVGVGASLGKVSWGLALTVAVGIAVIFSADTIVAAMGAGGDACVAAP